ncbi:Uncharacterized protein APZ42_020680 [Daphnia magna]|uniref:Uncharacterized protein n=1 Tax=Daphnia magna TaxID=35525 RepID=A0A164XA41_9CRUS|nr:Uncharacterized protein APZ42_020680 [Daphnia magna]
MFFCEDGQRLSLLLCTGRPFICNIKLEDLQLLHQFKRSNRPLWPHPVGVTCQALRKSVHVMERHSFSSSPKKKKRIPITM